MPIAPQIGETVDYHRRRPALDASGEITGVNGTRVDIASLGVTGVENIGFVGDPAAAASYWTYPADIGDGDPIQLV